MRKVTAGLFHSLDGAVEAPHEWQFDRFDDELGGLLTGVLGRTDTVIMGRKGFAEWAGYWPNAEVDAGFADFINAVPKHVATRTLTTLPAWQNVSIIAGDLDTFVRKLFPDGTGTTRLELVSSETTSKGNVVTTYRLLS